VRSGSRTTVILIDQSADSSDLHDGHAVIQLTFSTLIQPQPDPADTASEVCVASWPLARCRATFNPTGEDPRLARYWTHNCDSRTWSTGWTCTLPTRFETNAGKIGLKAATAGD
jgi:hypothetical protein